MLNRIVAAWAAGDADAFAAFYAQDATVVLPGDIHLKSRDEIRACMAAAFDGPFKGSTSADPEGVRFLGADAAVVISTIGILLPGESDLPAERRRRATWVLSRHDEMWTVAAYTNCPTNAPART